MNIYQQTFDSLFTKKQKDVFNRIEQIQISLLSSNEVLNMSRGEVISSETLNYKTLKPITGGLHCEIIFGPVEDWRCACGKYSGKIYKNVTCEDCGVFVDSSDCRRENIGHIKLNVPIVHPWMHLKAVNNPLCTLLGLTHNELVDVVFYRKFLKLDKNFVSNNILSVVNNEEYNNLTEQEQDLCGKGGYILLKTLQLINLETLILNTKNIKRSKLAHTFLQNNRNHENMVIQYLPVLPADLRPIVALDNGMLGTTDINDFYRTIILRNQRLNTLQTCGVPDMILEHCAANLQRSVDSLFDNGKLQYPKKNKNRISKSLTEYLSGKRGLLRSNLLGKRVDFSARSVIIVDPDLKLDECSIPKKIALELFKPFLMRHLTKNNIVEDIPGALKLINNDDPIVYQVLKTIVKTRNVMLNRAPTLHKHGIQSFKILLNNGDAIKIHPLVCEGFNADFDGDQMGVYLSITPKTVLETHYLLRTEKNIFSSANGHPVVKPVREILIGIYYLTTLNQDLPKQTFYNEKIAITAYKNNAIKYNQKIDVVINDTLIQDTSVGRILINNILPDEVKNYHQVIDKKYLAFVMQYIRNNFHTKVLSNFLDQIKELGFKYSTIAGISMSNDDILIPKKQHIVQKFQDIADDIIQLKKRNIISKSVYGIYNTEIWNECTEQITKELLKTVKPDNDVFNAIKSGARGTIIQARQLSGMKGLVSDASGNIIEYPIINCYKEGLSSFEYFNSSYGARKGIIDKALKTAHAGYLTRKLVDLTHQVITNQYDCQTKNGTKVYITKENLYSFVGTALAEDIKKINVVKNTFLTENMLNQLINTEILIRSPLTCDEKIGVCCMCYGYDLGLNKIVDEGSAVGIVAAQSICEPALQLTLRTFHTGGVLQKQHKNVVTFNGKTSLKLNLNEKHFKSLNDNNFYLKHVKHLCLVENKTLNLQKGDLLLVDLNQTIEPNDILAIRSHLVTHDIADHTGYLTFENKLIQKDNLKQNIAVKNLPFEIHSNDKVISGTFKKGSIILLENNALVTKGTIMSQQVIKGVGDIVDDLHIVSDILELRAPAKTALFSPIDGIFTTSLNADNTNIHVTNDNETFEKPDVESNTIIVSENQQVRTGDKLTLGNVSIKQLLTLKYKQVDIQNIIIKEIQDIYKAYNIDVAYKHLAIICKSMFSFVFSNDSNTIKHHSQITPSENVKTICLGITKAAINSTSFISACSFQFTKKILMENALSQSADNLVGLKENIIVGNPAPIGLYANNIKNLTNDNRYKKLHDVILDLENKMQENTDFIYTENWFEDILKDI